MCTNAQGRTKLTLHTRSVTAHPRQMPPQVPEDPDNPWYANGLRFSCQRSGNCCKTHGEYAFIYLADQDVLAISRHLGLEPAEFRSKHCAEDEGYTILQIDAPRCPFLAPDNSCSIYPVRPKQCATWPFWQENLEDQARWEGPVKQCCPGIGQGELHSSEEIEELADETEEWYE
jgi:uncharacterized protein